MPRVKIARLRDLDVTELRSHWQAVFGRPAPPHLARHLLFRTLAYRLQADRLGDLAGETSVCSTARGRLRRLDSTPCG